MNDSDEGHVPYIPPIFWKLGKKRRGKSKSAYSDAFVRPCPEMFKWEARTGCSGMKVLSILQNTSKHIPSEISEVHTHSVRNLF